MEQAGVGHPGNTTGTPVFQEFFDEVFTSRMRCQSEAARMLERELLTSMVGRDLFDDTPITASFDVELPASVRPFGTPPKLTRAEEGMGFHIEPLTDDIEEDFALFCNGGFHVDVESRQGTVHAGRQYIWRPVARS